MTRSEQKDNAIRMMIYGHLGKRSVSFLARETGICRQTLSYKLEHISAMTVPELRAVAKALGIPPEEIAKGFN